MSSPGADPTEVDFEIIHHGPLFRFSEQLRSKGILPRANWQRVLAAIAITWLPLVVLSFLAGHAWQGQGWGTTITDPFFSDIEVHARMLVALPLMLIAESIVSLSLKVQTHHLLTMGVIAESDREHYRKLQARAMAFRDSLPLEAILMLIAWTTAVLLRTVVGLTDGTRSWERIGEGVTLAGYWHALVSLPYLYFRVLNWLFIFFVWAKLLVGVSRLKLELTPTHPDRTGGLGFLGWGLASFAPVLMAISAVMSAGFAAQLQVEGAKLSDITHLVIAFVVAMVLLLHAPLFSFFPKLSACRFQGLLEFGALAWEHDVAFDKKWLKDTNRPGPSELLGTSDVQSMADIAVCYEHVNEMWLCPFDSKAFAVLVVSTLLPMIPLVGTAIPLQEIAAKLGELLL